MSSQFGQLVINTFNRRKLSRTEAYHIFVNKSRLKANLSPKVFFDKYLLEQHHKISWCYRVCEVFNISAKMTFEAILKDEDAEHLAESELIETNPKLYLYSYLFKFLCIEQLLYIIANVEIPCLKEESSLERVDTRADRIRRAILQARELTEDNKVISNRVMSLNVDNSIKLILQLRFFEGLSIEETCEETGYSKRYVQRLQEKGIETLKSSVARKV